MDGGVPGEQRLVGEAGALARTAAGGKEGTMYRVGRWRNHRRQRGRLMKGFLGWMKNGRKREGVDGRKEGGWMDGRKNGWKDEQKVGRMGGRKGGGKDRRVMRSSVGLNQ